MTLPEHQGPPIQTLPTITASPIFGVVRRDPDLTFTVHIAMENPPETP